MATTKHRGLVSGLAALSLTLLVMCSSTPAADGGSCEADDECESGRCVAGACGGSDCKCEGPVCRGRSSCREGWICSRGNNIEQPFPACRQECSATVACPAANRCDDGVCVAGAAPFSLAWINIPRTRPCSSMVPCDYRLQTPAVPVTKFTWFFGSTKVETTAPEASFTYPKDGTYDVSVRADGPNGAIGELRYTEVLCVGAPGAPCSTNGAPCCGGVCNVMGVCK